MSAMLQGILDLFKPPPPSQLDIVVLLRDFQTEVPGIMHSITLEGEEYLSLLYRYFDTRAQTHRVRLVDLNDGGTVSLQAKHDRVIRDFVKMGK